MFIILTIVTSKSMQQHKNTVIAILIITLPIDRHHLVVPFCIFLLLIILLTPGLHSSSYSSNHSSAPANSLGDSPESPGRVPFKAWLLRLLLLLLLTSSSSSSASSSSQCPKVPPTRNVQWGKGQGALAYLASVRRATARSVESTALPDPSTWNIKS